MKSVVIYFSMSGNTKRIAQAIHAGMMRSGEQCGNLSRVCRPLQRELPLSLDDEKMD